MELISDVAVKEHELWEGSNKNVKKSSLDAVGNDIKELTNDGYTVQVLYSISDVKSVLIIGTKEGSAESISGGDGNDSVTIVSGDDTVSGGSDTDTVTSGEGADTTNGGEDTVSGGSDTDAGDDTLTGGSDTDTDTVTGGGE